MFPELLINLELLFKVQGVEYFKEESDGDGSGFAVPLERLVFVETVIPVIDFFVQVIFDEFCVLELAVVDVDEFLQTNQLILIEVILILNDANFLLLHIQLSLLALLFLLKIIELLLVLFHLQPLRIK